MKKTLIKLSSLFLCGLLVSLFSGCKPVINPAGGINELITGCVTSLEDNTPVPGIKVSSNYGYTFTDENGNFEILSYYLVDNTDSESLSYSRINAYHEIKFTDVDGDENGKFKEKTESRKADSKMSMSVYLEKDL